MQNVQKHHYLIQNFA